MNDLLARLSILITRRPWVTIGVLLVITVIMAGGAGQRAPILEGADVALLPKDSDIVKAVGEIEELFEEIGDVSLVTLVFRGEALTPDGLSQMDELIGQITADPDAGPLLTSTNAVFSPAAMVRAALGVGDLGSVTQSS